LTYECIALDENDKLINGQNRLSACVRSGKTVPMMIVRNVPTINMTVIDSGLARTTVDASVVMGLDVSNRQQYIRTTRRMLEGLCIVKHHISNTAILEFLETHKKALDFAYEILPTKVPHITTAPVRAVIARAYYHCSQNKLREFAKILITGISTNEPVIHFRNWLLANPGLRGWEIHAKAETALKMFLGDLPFNGKLHGTKEELFPLPGVQYLS